MADRDGRMNEAIVFSVVNVGLGFVVAMALTHWFLPTFLGVQPWTTKKSFNVTCVFTVAALVRNYLVYWGFQ